MSNEQFWTELDKRFGPGEVCVCVSVSMHGMQAAHTSACVSNPIGEFGAVHGKTIKLGLAQSVDRKGLVRVRPGYEKQVSEQLEAHRRRAAVRPIELQLAGETAPPELPDGEEDI